MIYYLVHNEYILLFYKKGRWLKKADDSITLPFGLYNEKTGIHTFLQGILKPLASNFYEDLYEIL